MSIISKKLHDSKPGNLRKGRVAKLCPCGVWFSLPACHAARHKSCSAKCAKAQRDAVAKQRESACLECGARFIPRPNQVAKGQGRFCSLACSLHTIRRTPEFKDAVRNAPRSGPKPGPDNPMWTGGTVASTRRRIESGKSQAYTRKYRSENPERAREWAQNRRNRKGGRLAYGTLPRLMSSQRGRCANCLGDIRGAFHVDHIVPLARGGAHEAKNIQLLCAPCNLRKSDRDPIVFAQLNGRLL